MNLNSYYNEGGLIIMSQIKFKARCPDCGKQFIMGANVDAAETPNTRSNLEPDGKVFVYKITSDQIKDFIAAKAVHYCPGASVEVLPIYCEKKKRKDTESHHSYASLRVALSDNVLEKNVSNSWYGKIGESSDNVRVLPSIFQNLIRLYQYNPKDIDSWLKSYKNLEELEEGLGMTEAYIQDIKMYVRPRSVETKNKERWIIFSAAADRVIKDMLTDPTTGHVPGRIQIQDIYKISDNNVGFIVYLYPGEYEDPIKPHVREIMLGEIKSKK